MQPFFHANPLLDFINGNYIIFSGHDIYGNQAATLDYIFAYAGFVDVVAFKIPQYVLKKEFKDYLGKTLDMKRYYDIIYNNILSQIFINTNEESREPNKQGER